MKPPSLHFSLLSKILLSTSVAITLLFAASTWFAVDSATRATSESVQHEVHASFQAYQSLWKSRADRLSSISSILSTMSDVRAAFGTGDEVTIRDTAGELWSRVSDDEAIFLVATPEGKVIASLGGPSRQSLPRDLPVVREALAHFPAQTTGFLPREDRLYHITITPVYVQATGGTALLNVLVAGYEVDHGVAERLKKSTGDSEFIFVSQGRIVASTLPPATSSAIVRQLPRTPTSIRTGAVEFTPLITPLKDIQGNTVGQLAILRSSETANREIFLLRRNICMLWLYSMAAGLSFTYVMARRIIGPVKALDRAAAEVARQNYSCEVVVKSDDELGRLATTFNAMCASIRQAREELIRSERITTIGRLATSIVHDLRNPLAAVYGGAEMLMYSELSKEQTVRLAGNMYRGCRQIQELLQDLLDVGRGTSAAPQRCNLSELVAKVAEGMSATAERQAVEIVVEVPDNLELVLDQHRIERVFMNLMGNAIEAMSGPGTITVSAKLDQGAVSIEVRDTGPGIAPEIRGSIFQPFITAGKAGGLGLGLAFARQAVLDHGGDIWANSNPGQGASFTFRLPVNSGNGDPAVPASARSIGES